MANPKRRHSNMRTNLRRSHHAIKVQSLSKCSNCGASLIPHRVCAACGYYRGKQVMTIKVKESKTKE